MTIKAGDIVRWKRAHLVSHSSYFKVMWIDEKNAVVELIVRDEAKINRYLAARETLLGVFGHYLQEVDDDSLVPKLIKPLPDRVWTKPVGSFRVPLGELEVVESSRVSRESRQSSSCKRDRWVGVWE